MITLTLQCQHCHSANLMRNGLAPDGRQRYLCRDCRSRQPPRINAYTEAERETILRALTRTFGVARNTVTSWIKKK